MLTVEMLTVEILLMAKRRTTLSLLILSHPHLHLSRLSHPHLSRLLSLRVLRRLRLRRALTS